MLGPSGWALGVGLKAGSSKPCSKFGLEAHGAALSSFTQLSVILWEALEVVKDHGALAFYSEGVVNYL